MSLYYAMSLNSAITFAINDNMAYEINYLNQIKINNRKNIDINILQL